MPRETIGAEEWLARLPAVTCHDRLPLPLGGNEIQIWRRLSRPLTGRLP